MMNWNKNDDYTIISNVDLSTIRNFCSKEDIIVEEDNIVSHWILFSYFEARENSINIPLSRSFSNNITEYMTGKKGIFNDDYVKESQISKVVNEMLERLSADDNQLEQKIDFYHRLLLYYRKNGVLHEKKVFKHDCYIAENQYEKMMELNRLYSSSNHGQTIQLLLENYNDNDIEIDATDEPRIKRLTFYLTYTSEELFSRINAENDYEKVIKLINN